MEFIGEKEPYEAAMRGDWDAMVNWYKENEALLLFFPLSFGDDTAFHFAVYSGRENPLKDLLELSDNYTMTSNVFTRQNASGNTALHEAASCGNYKAAKLLVEKNNSCQITHIRNKRGETPLFVAAAYGRNKVVNYLANLPDQMPDQKLDHIHRYSITETSDTADAPTVHASILHVAIQGEHFGTALLLLKLDESLLQLAEKSDDNSDSDVESTEGEHYKTALELLATIPSAFKSGYHMDVWTALLYCCTPVGVDDDDDQNDEHSARDDDMKGDFKVALADLESGNQNKNHRRKFSCKDFVERIYQSIWRILLLACPKLKQLQKAKRKHESAFKLAHVLTRKDKSWLDSVSKESKIFRKEMEHQSQLVESGQMKIHVVNSADEPAAPIRSKVDTESLEEGSQDKKNHVPSNDDKKIKGQKEDYEKNPLFYATKNGIIEIVKEILDVHPQAALSVTPMWHNILHVAIRHRQKEIFDKVKRMHIPMKWLVRGIDKNGYTILHHAATMEGHTGRTRPGPAFQLQEELKWLSRVKKVTPSHYSRLPDKEQNKTAEDLFKENHKKLLEEAQKWIKDTSQSCSQVAVLVATLVFAAAYTVPGGPDKDGHPILLDSTLFLVFTIMDVISLCSSLTSVVTFLSILSSPFELEDFHHSLPRKLTIGFSLLFFSVATTMVAFTATIFLTIRSDNGRWSKTLCYSAALIPIGIFAVLQFPLYVAVEDTLRYISKATRKTLLCRLLRGLLRKIKCKEN